MDSSAHYFREHQYYKTPRQAERGEEPKTVKMLCRSEVVRRESLGGAWKWYERKAA